MVSLGHYFLLVRFFFELSDLLVYDDVLRDYELDVIGLASNDNVEHYSKYGLLPHEMDDYSVIEMLNIGLLEDGNNSEGDILLKLGIKPTVYYLLRVRFDYIDESTWEDTIPMYVGIPMVESIAELGLETNLWRV